MSLSCGLWILLTVVAAEPPQLQPGETWTLTEDFRVGPGQSLEIVGTPEKPCEIVGNGHSLRTAQCLKGKITLKHCRLKNLGAAGIKPEKPAMYLHVYGETQIVIEHCTFDECAGIHLHTGEKSTADFRHNTVLANSLVAVSKDVDNSRPCFHATGNSTGAKRFQGNRIFKAAVQFDSPQWLVGGDTDADSNLLIGQRVKFIARGDTSVIRGNYLHVVMPRNAEFPYWSQVSTLDGGGALVEHNVIRDGEWIVQMFTGEIRYNVICDINDHNLMRNGSAGKVHHNVFHVGKPDHPPGSMSAFIYIVYPPKESEGGMEIYSNTFDGCGIFEPPGVEVCEKGFVKSLRNNVFCNMRLTKYFKLPPAVVRPAWNEDGTAAMERLGYADYNLFHNPSAEKPLGYTLNVAGKKPRENGFGAHDAQVDPQFAGPTPKAFPFHDDDIIAGKVTVSQMLAQFRKLYSPAEKSPLIDAGDPADGRGTEIGAVGAGVEDERDRFGRWGQIQARSASE